MGTINNSGTLEPTDFNVTGGDPSDDGWEPMEITCIDDLGISVTLIIKDQSDADNLQAAIRARV